MRSLFTKIFLSFWLTIVVVGVALAVSIAYAANTPQLQLRVAASGLLPNGANEASEEFENSGQLALAQYLKDVELRYPVIAFFFDQDGRELLSHNPSQDVRRAAAAATKESLYLRGNTAAQRAAGPSGREYSLVLLSNPYNPTAIGKAGVMKMATLFLPLITLVAGTAFCFLLTRHITSPLFRLRAAARDLAQGRLETRVTPQLGRRRDEISALGHDFDGMAERLEALIAGHKRLLGDVSHELRSPLSRLVVALGLAKNGSPAEHAEHFERIALEAHRLDNLIGQLLTLSRIDSGSHTVPPDSFDLTNLVHEVASDANFETRAHSRRVVVTAADEVTITGFEELLRSAIENVVRNAARFTREGTSVEISLQRESGKPILRVRDHGPGVPEDMLSEIFLPFRRVPNSGDAPTEGAGLGLAIAQRAVAMNRGTIRALNAPDGGLIVEIEFAAVKG